MSKYVLGDSEPPLKWVEPWEYDRWRAVVLKDEELDEEMLKALYAEQWEPQELYKALLHNQRFKRAAPKKKTRQVVVDLETVEKRIAKAIWVECGRLLPRRMTPEARSYVCKVQEQAERAAGITIYR